MRNIKESIPVCGSSKAANIHKRQPSRDRYYEVYPLSRREGCLYFLAGGFAAALVGYLFYRSLAVSAFFFFLPVLYLKEYKRRKLEQRKELLNFSFKDALYSMSASVAAGRSLSVAIADAGENLKKLYGEESPVSREFAAMSKRIRSANGAPEQALMELGRKSNLEDIRNIAEVCSICTKTGGDLERAISKSVNIITDKINLRSEISALTAQKKLEVRLLTTIPFLVLAFLQISSSDYMNVLYETTGGRMIMTMSLLAIAASYFWGQKITDIKV